MSENGKRYTYTGRSVPPTKDYNTHIADSKSMAGTPRQEAPEPKNWIFAAANRAPLKVKEFIPRRPKIYYVNYDNYGPGYYRCAVPGLMMRALGYVESRYREEIPQTNQAVAEALGWCDVLFFQRVTDLNVLGAFKEVQAKGKAVIFEADDYVNDIAQTSDERVKFYWNKEAVSNFLECARESDGLILSTKRLTDVYRQQTGNKAYWVPNGLDTRNFRWNIEHNKFEQKGYITICYMGGSTHGQDLEVCRRPLVDAVNRYDNVKLKFIGLVPEWANEIKEDRLIADATWKTIAEYPASMADVDIGLVPLKNMPFNSIGKSCLKWLEYTMVGAATIASKVGETGDEIRNNHTGLLASTEDGWEVYLKKLIEHPSLITDLNKNAVKYVLNYRSIDVMIDKWLYAINSIIDRRVSIYANKAKVKEYAGGYRRSDPERRFPSY